MEATIITQQAANQSFRFLDLPTELRIIIYELVFANKSVHLLHRVVSYNPPALLIANKQIHQEATLLFYRHTTFHVWHPKVAMLRWLKNLPSAYRRALQGIKIYGPRSTTKSAKEEALLVRKGMEDKGVQMEKGVLWVTAWPNRQLFWTNELGQTESY